MAMSGHVSVNGAKIRYQRAGKGDVLLFLHGEQGLNGWEPHLDALSRHFDVVAPDHPGFGESDTPDWLEDVSDVASGYGEFLEKLGIGSAHLVGQSLGGWIALQMATSSKEKVRSLVLLNSAGIRIKGQLPADIFFCPRDEVPALLFGGDGWREWKSGWDATPESQDIFDKNMVGAARLTWHPRMWSPKLQRWLHRVSCPTHVIWGEQDKVIPATYAHEIARLIGGSTIEIVPERGHMLHLEDPEMFVDRVRAFLEERAQ